MAARTFATIIAAGPRGLVFAPLPFDPDAVWGKRPRHHVSGLIAGRAWRGPLDKFGDAYGLKLGPAWRRDNGFEPGDRVDVEIAPEGPQRDALDPDIAAALAAEPKASAAFDGLAQFYRKGYLTWIGATKKKPEERARRIRETVRLLKAGVKERPR